MDPTKRPFIRDVLWTVDQAATVLGVSPRTIRKWVTIGQIESIKVGTRRMIPNRAIHRYFQTLLADPETRQATIDLLNSHAAALGKEPLRFEPIPTAGGAAGESASA